MGLGNMGTSIVRTATPIIVGAILTLLLSLGIELPEELAAELLTAIALALTALVQIIYYVVSRFVEEKFPQFGFLLGIARTPDSYSPPLETNSLSKEAPAYTPEISVSGLEADPNEKSTMYLSQLDTSTLTPTGLDRSTVEHMRLPDLDVGKMYLPRREEPETDLTPPAADYRPRHAQTDVDDEERRA